MFFKYLSSIKLAQNFLNTIKFVSSPSIITVHRTQSFSSLKKYIDNVNRTFSLHTIKHDKEKGMSYVCQCKTLILSANMLFLRILTLFYRI